MKIKLEFGQQFLGKGYKELVPGSGRYISADGTRAFRMGENDILGIHGGGVSLDVDPNSLSKFGGAYQIESVPEGLKIIQRGGRSEHFEIVPSYEMSVDKFQNLLNQIKTVP